MNWDRSLEWIPPFFKPEFIVGLRIRPDFDEPRELHDSSAPYYVLDTIGTTQENRGHTAAHRLELSGVGW